MSAALITGASRGIGRAIARALAGNGYDIAVNYLSGEAQASALVSELSALGVNAACFRADVSKADEVTAMTEAVKKRFGIIDALVNNAGIANQALLTDVTDEQWARMLSVNLTGVFNCCRAVLPDMINKKSGKILNIASIWGQAGASMEVPYSAAKAGVIGLTKALAKEVAPSGITVNCVCPGVIKTDMLDGFSGDDLAALTEEIPLGRLGTPEDVAKAVAYLLSPAAGYVTGQILGINGGFYS